MSPPSVASARMTPKSDTRGVKVKVDAFHLDDIPGAMDKMGWKVSAQMMRYWFNAPAWVMSEAARVERKLGQLYPQRINLSIITMKWLLGFERFKKAFNALYAVWHDETAAGLLKERLLEAGWAGNSSMQLASTSLNALQLDSLSQIRRVTIGDYMDTFDDLYGAVFKANLKVAVTGYTDYSNAHKRNVFKVNKLGFYIKDTYDFNAGWFEDYTIGLGIWSRDRMLSKAETSAFMASSYFVRATVFRGFVPVTNADFRSWQKTNNEGGDFYVFSDVLWIEPDVKEILL